MDLSRKQFVHRVGTVLAALAFRPSVLLGSGADGFRPLRRGTGLFVARGGTIGWLATPDAVLVVDTQFPDTAASFLAGLRERVTRPIDVLINTHHHGDHVGGNAVVGANAARHIAHRNVPDLIRQAGSAQPGATVPALPTETFDEALTINLGDERIHLTHPGPAHTAGDLVVFFEAAQVVHMGDLVFNRMAPFVDLPGGASLGGWIRMLEATHARFDDDTVFVFGHAGEGFDVTGSRADLLAARDFMTAALDLARRRLAGGAPAAEIEQLEVLPGFPAHTQSPWMVQSLMQAALASLSAG
jgi:cyclase